MYDPSMQQLKDVYLTKRVCDELSLLIISALIPSGLIWLHGRFRLLLFFLAVFESPPGDFHPVPDIF